jgi:hypothetical protein
MASKKSTSKKKTTKATHYAVVRSAELSGTVENTALRILQVDRELSKLNRRLYRMGRYYQTKIDMRPTGDGLYEVYALRDDWAVQKGFQMAYAQYVKNVSDEKANMSKSQLARWADFKVGTGASGALLLSKLHDPTGAASILTNGEFSLANVVDQAGTTRTFTWSPAPAATEYSILNEYDRAGDAQDTPDNLAAPGPYEDIDADTDAATYDHLEQDGNQPPYDRNTVNQASPFVRVATLGASAGVQRLSTGFFTAPCGIVLIVGPNASWNSDLMTMTVKSGDYKGVHAPSMLE